ncbi:MAG: HNH endonuclease [Actinomycetota bacterium]
MSQLSLGIPIEDPDFAIRLVALDAVADTVRRYGGEGVPAAAIRSFAFDGRLVPLRAQQGIFRPKEMRGAALSISTVVPKSGPPRYDDAIAADAGAFVYRYRDNGPSSHDNRILRAAYEMQTPIIYFYGVDVGVYMPIAPCFVTHDDPVGQCVLVEPSPVAVGLPADDALHPDEVERRYATRVVRTRLHQRRFREIVLRAYARRCTICRLREPQLLQAAHIVPDRDRRGEASVPNGLSLCAIHHGAFDHNLLTITPDYEVRLSRRLLDDEDGPMLEQGLKAFHRRPIHLPRRMEDRPSRDALEERLAEFVRAA